MPEIIENYHLDAVKKETDIKKLVALSYAVIACNMAGLINPAVAAECYQILQDKLGFPPFVENLDNFVEEQGWLNNEQ